MRLPAGGPLPTSLRSNRKIMSHDELDDRKALKRQKKEYRDEKKRVTAQLVSALRDPTVVVMADWLKVRGSLRKWSRYWCVLKPGLMILYKNNNVHKNGHWIGTILLNTCELIERPSKKDGFCFKLYQPLDQSIWATRGPLGESQSFFAIQQLPAAHLICRAASEQAGRCWMDALELSLRCTGLLMRTMHSLDNGSKSNEDTSTTEAAKEESEGECEAEPDSQPTKEYSDTEAEKHFDEMEDVEPEVEEADGSDNEITQSEWIESEKEVFPNVSSGSQTEEVADENKSLVWALLKQVRPGMDLSKVVLPTFILEPRSFLEKLADYYYHADLLAEAAADSDPYQRIVKVVRFYLSGFYKKPKGLKKPYNPILGETFRCCWKHSDGSTTYYLAEQISHHPPVSSLFITNRKAGYNIAGTILAKSKFYGNSISAIMEGDLQLTLLNRGETYEVGLPYANCKGIMIGTMTMELAGPVTIKCVNTGYACELDFHLKPFMGGTMNKVSGKIKYGDEELARISGTWDGMINLTERKTGNESILWNPTPEIIKTRLPRYEIPYEKLENYESRKLWSKVTEAINEENQYKATEEKTVLEQDQRARAKSEVPHKTKYFKVTKMAKNPGEKWWSEYKYNEYRPWDHHTDLEQIEHNYVISTRSQIKTKRQKEKRVSNADSQVGSDESSDNEDGSVKLQKKKIGSVASSDLEELKVAIKDVSQLLTVTARRLDGSIERQMRATLPSLQTILVALSAFAILQAILIAFLVKNTR